MSIINIVYLMDELKRLKQSLRDLDIEYRKKTIGVVYTRKRALLEDRVKSQTEKVIKVISPGNLCQWEITIETSNGIEVRYITYPAQYDKLDTIKVINAMLFIEKQPEIKVIDVNPIGMIQMGKVYNHSGFE